MTLPLTRDDAERIARAHVGAMGDLARERGVFTVRTLSEVRGETLQLPALYGLEDAETTLIQSWFVYISEAHPHVMKSSWVIVVSTADGSTKYSGSAHDEG